MDQEREHRFASRPFSPGSAAPDTHPTDFGDQKIEDPNLLEDLFSGTVAHGISDEILETVEHHTVRDPRPAPDNPVSPIAISDRGPARTLPRAAAHA
ncbi:MAG: hypothetical protein AAB801_01420 [Patescibacteria group bacterium]